MSSPPVSRAPGRIAKRRKTYTRFSEAEHALLIEGVNRFGIGKWKAILDSYSGWAGDRDAVALKDRWRTLMRRRAREETGPAGYGGPNLGSYSGDSHLENKTPSHQAHDRLLKPSESYHDPNSPSVFRTPERLNYQQPPNHHRHSQGQNLSVAHDSVGYQLLETEPRCDEHGLDAVGKAGEHRAMNCRQDMYGLPSAVSGKYLFGQNVSQYQPPLHRLGTSGFDLGHTSPRDSSATVGIVDSDRPVVVHCYSEVNSRENASGQMSLKSILN